MRKIISLFKRDYEGTKLIYDELVEGAEWVQNGAGIATRKWDGTACMFKDDILYKRLHLKEGKPVPVGWLHWDFNPEQKTGHGWVLVGDGPEDAFHREGLDNRTGNMDGTYELIGPRIQKNPEKMSKYRLVRHGIERYTDCPRTYKYLKEWFRDRDIEGVVWHRDNGDMVKIKAKDFGINRKDDPIKDTP